MESSDLRFERSQLEEFCQSIFTALGLSDADSRTSAQVLVTADAIGIPSHGVGRLWRYVNGLKTGQMKAIAPEIVTETPGSLVIDAKGGMGPPVSVLAMDGIIRKAKDNGTAFGCVKDSNHFGIAGYYARMALKEDMIGIAMTNTAALGVPTFGRKVMFGTNPLAFAAPADREQAFVLDMSTTVVPRGKIEVYDRQEKELPAGWAVDKRGLSAHDPRRTLDDMLDRVGGGLLPLGGIGTEFGGHKGYGLAVMVDILCSVLCGAPHGQNVFDTQETSARVSHFFGAIRIESFREPKEFKADMDRMLQELRETPPAENEERVYYAGLREMEREAETHDKGVPISQKTHAMLEKLGKEFGVEPLRRRV